ncbi:hypothetical protein Tco_1166225 [Tanacetum coccineum]
MTSSASSSTKNPPRKMARNNVIDISSNESSPIQENNLIPATLNTTLALSITPPIISQTSPNQLIEASPLAPQALVFSTPPSSLIEPHHYLNSLKDLPPRSSNPPPPPPTQGINQTLPQHTTIDFKPFFPPINLSRKGNRISAQPEPFMSRDQVFQEFGRLQDFSHNIEAALQNAQNVQNGLLPQEPPHHTSQIPPPSFYPFTTFQTLQTSTIPLFRPILPPSHTFVPLNQSLWIKGPSSIPQPQEHTCLYF